MCWIPLHASRPGLSTYNTFNKCWNTTHVYHTTDKHNRHGCLHMHQTHMGSSTATTAALYAWPACGHPACEAQASKEFPTVVDMSCTWAWSSCCAALSCRKVAVLQVPLRNSCGPCRCSQAGICSGHCNAGQHLIPPQPDIMIPSKV